MKDPSRNLKLMKVDWFNMYYWIGLEIESDVVEVINVINDISEDLTEMKNLVEVIVSSSTLVFVVFLHYRRSSNIAAYCVVQQAYSFTCDFFLEDLLHVGEGHFFWVPEIPSFVLSSWWEWLYFLLVFNESLFQNKK